jgi:hypothetical protein
MFFVELLRIRRSCLILPYNEEENMYSLGLEIVCGIYCV